MRAFWTLVLFFMIFLMGIVVGLAIYDAEKQQECVGTSVVVDGDTLKIVEWTEYDNMYVLENGLVYRLKEK